MTDQELDALMKRVLMDSIKPDLDADTTVPFHPSPRHRRQMSSMLKDPLKWARKKTRPMWKTVAQKAAVILLVACLGFGGLIAGSPTVRAAMTRWFTQWNGTWVTYRYYDHELPERMPRYEITALPEGFVEIDPYEFRTSAGTLYEDAEGYLISFNYVYMTQDTGISFDTKNAQIFDIKVNHMEGKLFLPTIQKDGMMSTVTWVDEEANIQFSLSGEADRVDLLRLAESVSLVKTTK